MRAKNDHNINTNNKVNEDIHDKEIVYSDARHERVKDTGEVFTPPELVNKMLDELDYDWEKKPPKTFLDPTCGTGNFLIEIAKRGIHPEFIYGVDLMDDNITITKERLKKIHLENGVPENEIDFHHNRNIVQGDALTYHYNFWQHDNLDEW